MELILYLVTGIAIGAIIGWLVAKSKSTASFQNQASTSFEKYNKLENEYIEYKATTKTQLETAIKNLDEKNNEIIRLNDLLNSCSSEQTNLKENISDINAQWKSALKTIQEKNEELVTLKEELKFEKENLNKINQELATATANNEALTEKLQTQKDEIEAIGKKFNLEFENIANKIFDIKTEKFTELNKTNLEAILDPLGKNITEFKTKVQDVYDKESKERFSLGERVKELAQLNKVISEEAHNLTKALKGESKTQGDWGQMILESILEKSGLVKDQEYFMEYQLVDEDGKPLRSDSENKKMRPDAVIKYPDNRHVIIDSKVSLNAFTRCVGALDDEERQKELLEHVACIKRHILSLSAKGYDDYNKSLDFVMMFVPSESAYIAAMQCDSGLWSFAYDKRILLLSPTNLITSLKLIVDLWKREYQNQNALEIAERGAKLYDKFVGFIENLSDVGKHLEKAQEKYSNAYGQLSTGNDNLVIQATKLKNLGLKAKKALPNDLINVALNTELADIKD